MCAPNVGTYTVGCWPVQLYTYLSRAINRLSGLWADTSQTLNTERQQFKYGAATNERNGFPADSCRDIARIPHLYNVYTGWYNLYARNYSSLGKLWLSADDITDCQRKLGEEIHDCTCLLEVGGRKG